MKAIEREVESVKGFPQFCERSSIGFFVNVGVFHHQQAFHQTLAEHPLSAGKVDVDGGRLNAIREPDI